VEGKTVITAVEPIRCRCALVSNREWFAPVNGKSVEELSFDEILFLFRRFFDRTEAMKGVMHGGYGGFSRASRIFGVVKISNGEDDFAVTYFGVSSFGDS